VNSISVKESRDRLFMRRKQERCVGDFVFCKVRYLLVSIRDLAL